jgi:serine/threonine protein phosphatase PrpC
MSQSPTTSLVISVAMETHVGRQRQQNQDAIGQLVPTDPDVQEALGQIFVLADGVGGLQGGDLASQYAVSTIIRSYYEQPEGDPPDRLARAIAEANNVIYDEGQSQEAPTTMATTVVVAVVRDRDLVIGSVGDSPAYLVRDARPRKLTLDHTVASLPPDEQAALPDGDAAGPMLVRALGVAPSVKVDIITGRVRDGDCVVLCSDGLTRYVIPEEIERAVATQPVLSAAKSLVETANERGGADNVSVIVLRLADESLALLPPLDDPLLGWGRSRRSEQAERPRLRESKVRIGSQAAPGTPAAEPLDNPLRDLWQFVRGNTVLTGVGMAALLVLFVIIMFVIAGVGGDDEDSPDTRAAATQAAQRTATATLIHGITAQAAAAQTSDAIQEATAAEIARRTLTPPTPPPTSGPQMPDGVWFKVLDGDPIPTYEQSDLGSRTLTALVAGENYRVLQVVHDQKNGPWYEVVDNLGQEVRWVNGPSLHKRIVLIDLAGNPLPPNEQPLDVPPSGDMPPATISARETPALDGTPGTPPITPSAAATARPAIAYGVESWADGELVATKTALDLCRIPDITACTMGAVEQGEVGAIVDGPTPAGEHWWWKVEYDDGRSGWIAQVLLTTP